MPSSHGVPNARTSLPTSAEYTVADQERMRRARRYFEWQYRMADAALGSRVLEVGCGLGNFTAHLSRRELVVAVDIEPECVRRLSARVPPLSNVIATVADIADPSFRALGAHRIDSIVCLNVLEHIQDDRAALENMAAILPAGGKIVLIVPAFEALYGPIDWKLGHYRRYSKRSLTETALSVGLEAKTVRYFNLIGFFGWWFNARVSKRAAQSSTQIALFDSLIVPIQAAVERFMAPPFGQSLFAVLVKRY